MLRNAIRSSWWGLILSEHDTEPTEMASGLLKMLIAAVLILPYDTFAANRVYGMLGILPEPVWAIMLFLIGCTHLGSLHQGNRRWRRAMAGAGFLIWFTWSASFFAGNPTNTGGVVYGLAALGCGWCYVRLGRAP